jgi:tRNA (guanine37-N1)-methyltransferase
MQFEVFTLLPEVFPPYLESSILQRARQRGLIEVRVHNIREYTHDKHHTTDDTPYGGGGGMVMKPEPVFEAVESVLGISSDLAVNIPVILLTPGARLHTAWRRGYHCTASALLCGSKAWTSIREHLVTDEISIGDYVLTGGGFLPLIPSMRFRLIPGVLGDPARR